MWTEHRFISFDETPIFYRRLTTQDAPKAAALIVHGMGEHGGRYRLFAEYLAGQGVECWVPDLRGFGQSGGKRACLRHFSDFHRDLAALHALAARQNKSTPLFLLGHSFGGLVTSSYLALSKTPDKVRGLILSSPIFGIAVPVPAWRHWLGVAASSLFPDYTQPNGVNAATLTHDPAVSAQYDKDPLIFHGISARLYRELARMITRRARIASALDCPVLIAQAGEDHVVSKERTVDFYNSLKTTDKELEIYEGFYHEVLNESRRGLVFSRIGLWITRRLKHI